MDIFVYNSGQGYHPVTSQNALHSLQGPCVHKRWSGCSGPWYGSCSLTLYCEGLWAQSPVERSGGFGNNYPYACL